MNFCQKQIEKSFTLKCKKYKTLVSIHKLRFMPLVVQAVKCYREIIDDRINRKDRIADKLRRYSDSTLNILSRPIRLNRLCVAALSKISGKLWRLIVAAGLRQLILRSVNRLTITLQATSRHSRLADAADLLFKRQATDVASINWRI